MFGHQNAALDVSTALRAKACVKDDRSKEEKHAVSRVHDMVCAGAKLVYQRALCVEVEPRSIYDDNDLCILVSTDQVQYQMQYGVRRP